MSSGVKERVDRWMSRSFSDDLRKMWEGIKSRKTKLLVVFAWSVAFAVITLKSYWLVYAQNPILFKYAMIVPRVPQWFPRLLVIDYVVMIIVSGLAGALLIDLADVLYGWLVSTLLSFFLSVVLAFLFVWYSVGVGSIFSDVGIANVALIPVAELVMLNVFKMWFPLVPIISLVTVFCGAMIRSTTGK